MPSMRVKDRLGQRYGRLTVFSRAPNRRRNAVWSCVCDCGNELTVLALSLGSGNTNSCGCIHKEGLVERNWKDGRTKHSLYQVWRDMLARCHNPKHRNFKYYGARMIFVCAEWQSDFWKFVSDMGEKPGIGYSIERIDNDRGYSKSNCKWATSKEQAENKRPHGSVFNAVR